MTCLCTIIPILYNGKLRLRSNFFLRGNQVLRKLLFEPISSFEKWDDKEYLCHWAVVVFILIDKKPEDQRDLVSCNSYAGNTWLADFLSLGLLPAVFVHKKWV